MVDLLEKLGFFVNREKFVLVLFIIIYYLGYILDFVKFKVFFLDEKIDKIIIYSGIFLNKKVFIIREIVRLIGLFIFFFYVINLGVLFFRYLDRDKV